MRTFIAAFMRSLSVRRISLKQRGAKRRNSSTHPHEDSIIFSRGATEGINLVAASYGQRLGAGDEIITTELEHHSNIVPWQIIAEKQGAKVLFAPMDDNGALDMDALRSLISNRTQIVAVTHVANTMGTVLPVKEIAWLAHAVGAVILVDGCQAGPAYAR